MVGDQVTGRASQEIICGEHPPKVPDRGLEQTHALVGLGEVDSRDKVQDLVDNIGVAHYNRRGQSVYGSSTPTISKIAGQCVPV